jgi:hypothetical protein
MYAIFHTPCRVLSCHKYISYVEVHQCLLEFFFLMIVLSLNLIQYTSNKQKNPNCDVYTYIKKPNVEIQYL